MYNVSLHVCVYIYICIYLYTSHHVLCIYIYTLLVSTHIQTSPSAHSGSVTSKSSARPFAGRLAPLRVSPRAKPIRGSGGSVIWMWVNTQILFLSILEGNRGAGGRGSGVLTHCHRYEFYSGTLRWSSKFGGDSCPATTFQGVPDVGDCLRTFCLKHSHEQYGHVPASPTSLLVCLFVCLFV